jgi:hypothetical protein
MCKETPEEYELEKKQAELAALEAELAKRELALKTLQAKLNSFEREFLQVVGIRCAKLDAIEAEIAKYVAFSQPKNFNVRRQAAQAQVKAIYSQRAIKQNLSASLSTKEFQPAENLKKLYRDVAKRIHPDLATDEVERLRRQKLMAEANLAYENGDAAQLQTILQRWEHSPEFIKGDSIGAQLVRAIRQIAQIKHRLSAIALEMETWKQSEIYLLREKVILARLEGYDLLLKMAAQIDRQISVAKIYLQKLRIQVEVCA